MSDELFQVSFSGQIGEGTELEKVKQRVAKIFNADAATLIQLFSGKPVVIKKNIDYSTAEKYQTALKRAGAESTIKSMSSASNDQVDKVARVDSRDPGQDSVSEHRKTASSAAASMSPRAEDSANTGNLQPPQTDPLGIKGEQIEDLAATLAPLGSEIQERKNQIDEPRYDLSEFDLAPVGSELSAAEKDEDAPAPDITGISLAD